MIVADYGGKVANGNGGNNLSYSDSFYMQKQASFNEDVLFQFYDLTFCNFKYMFLNIQQEQLRRRREEEERIAAQNDFLRNSLRSSQRLRALQDNPVVEKPASGVENEAYIEDEEPEKIIGKSAKHEGSPHIMIPNYINFFRIWRASISFAAITGSPQQAWLGRTRW